MFHTWTFPHKSPYYKSGNVFFFYLYFLPVLFLGMYFSPFYVFFTFYFFYYYYFFIIIIFLLRPHENCNMLPVLFGVRNVLSSWEFLQTLFINTSISLFKSNSWAQIKLWESVFFIAYLTSRESVLKNSFIPVYDIKLPLSGRYRKSYLFQHFLSWSQTFFPSYMRYSLRQTTFYIEKKKMI